MKIDLTGTLYESQKKAVAEYNRLKDSGDIASAKRKAGEIAKICRQIADMNPASRKENLERAKRWEIAAGIRPADKAGKPAKKAGSSENEEENESEIASKIESLITTSNVKWSDIGGLDYVKQLMMETVVIAGLKKPDSIKPWKGILLFGPPGTGKTLLAAAAAGSLDAAFYDVKSESVLSKYFGESSKLISALYNSARTHSPSIVFIDEFDALSQSREGETSEATRKVLSSLLTELDGLSDKKSDRLLLTLAATNTPWDLDTAVLSRFPRRIYVPLPDEKACEAIIKIQLKDMDLSKINLGNIAKKCVEMRYSGRDLSNFCQQSVWTMIHDVNKDLYKLAEMPFEELKKKSLKTRPLCDEDFAEVWNKIRSPLKESDIRKYEEWNEKCGEI